MNYRFSAAGRDMLANVVTADERDASEPCHGLVWLESLISAM
jgi:hypothetical protein